MSDKQKGDIPTNEKIIDDLTKDLDSQFVINNSVAEKGVSSEDSNVDITVPITGQDIIPEDFNESDSESNKEKDTLPDNFIDDEALKTLEEALTDEEKETRHKNALEVKVKGNDEFKSEKYLESIYSYTEALKLCPLKFTSDRSVFYANRGASKSKLGRTEAAIEDCTKALELNDKYTKALLRRAKLYEGSSKLDEALEDYKKILELDPGNKDAVSGCCRLPPLIDERNEKMKTEMLGKLKDLGNMFLRPFGLSTENFKLQQDPNSGGYTVNFQQNPSS